MIKDITLGQYFPTESHIHKLDARIKVILSILYMVIIFLVSSLWGYLLLGIFTFMLMRLSRVPINFFLRGLKALMFFVALTAVMNLFWTPGNIVWQYGFLKITDQGIYHAIFMFSRILLMVIVSSLLTYTTSPIMLTAAIESLLKPFDRLIPAHEIAMMMTIALRFIPTLLEEADKIMKAQMARCADFESGNVFKRAKAMVPLLVPLFISAFRRAEELATAMESRCYRGGEGRTSFHRQRVTFKDGVAVALIVGVGVVMVWMRGI